VDIVLYGLDLFDIIEIYLKIFKIFIYINWYKCEYK